MKKENPKFYIIAALVCAVASVSFFAYRYKNARSELEEFRTVTGSEEEAGFLMLCRPFPTALFPAKRRRISFGKSPAKRTALSR